MKPKLKHAQTSLERARAVAEAFVPSQEEMWSSFWPFGHCAVSSLLLAPLLRALDDRAGWRVAIGVVAYPRVRRPWHDMFGHEAWMVTGEPLRHAWCENAAGDVVDVTYGQFDGLDPVVVLPAALAGDLGHYASKIMTLNEEEYARRSIEARNDGWSVTSSVRVFFGLVELGL